MSTGEDINHLLNRAWKVWRPAGGKIAILQLDYVDYAIITQHPSMRILRYEKRHGGWKFHTVQAEHGGIVLAAQQGVMSRQVRSTALRFITMLEKVYRQTNGDYEPIKGINEPKVDMRTGLVVGTFQEGEVDTNVDDADPQD